MKCPLADYWKKWNIECPLTLKQDKKECQKCDYWRDGKCRYKKIMAEVEKEIDKETRARLPELTKRAIMRAREKGPVDEGVAKKLEQAASELSKKSGLPLWKR